MILAPKRDVFLLLLGILTLTGAKVANSQVVMDRAATAGESYARGVADMMRSAGDRNLSNSQAAINLQDAYSKGLDNSLKSVDTYWARRDVYNERLAQEHYEIGQRRQRKLERNRLQPLTPQEFDRTTGTINWPKALTQTQYDEYRSELEALFQKRAENGFLSSDDYLAASTASRAWRDQLGSQRDYYPSNVLSQMVRFILKLDRELNDNLS